MTDVYDQRGKPIEWELDDLPGPTEEQLNAVIDSLNTALLRLQNENERLAGELDRLTVILLKEREIVNVMRQGPCYCDPPGCGEEFCNGGCELRAELARIKAATRAVVRSWNDGERVGRPMQELEALLETE